MAFSGSQITGLQVYGSPGRVHSFSAKDLAVITTILATATLEGDFAHAVTLSGDFAHAVTLEGSFTHAVTLKGDTGK